MRWFAFDHIAARKMIRSASRQLKLRCWSNSFND
jgi:hypothetical protein